jgi:hypothetical protein
MSQGLAAKIFSGHVKIALVTAFCAIPVVGLMVMNGFILEAARPKLLEIREAILGYEETHLREMMDAQRGVYTMERHGVEVEGGGGGGGGEKNELSKRSLFAGIHAAGTKESNQPLR